MVQEPYKEKGDKVQTGNYRTATDGLGMKDDREREHRTYRYR